MQLGLALRLRWKAAAVMMSIHQSEWPKDLALPLSLLIVPMIMSVIGAGEFLLLTFPVGLAVGYFIRPKRVWAVWLGSIAMLWIVYGIAVLVGTVPGPNEPNSGETVWSFMFESVIFMTLLVLLPVWFGRLLYKGVHEKVPEA